MFDDVLVRVRAKGRVIKGVHVQCTNEPTGPCASYRLGFGRPFPCSTATRKWTSETQQSYRRQAYPSVKNTNQIAQLAQSTRLPMRFRSAFRYKLRSCNSFAAHWWLLKHTRSKLINSFFKRGHLTYYMQEDNHRRGSSATKHDYAFI